MTIQPSKLRPDPSRSHQEVCFDEALIRRYGGRGPRYTSYPTALQFNQDFSLAHYRRQAAAAEPDRPLSIYVHIPFCERLCYYCGCNKIVTRNRLRISRYLEQLCREIEMQATLFDRDRTVEQLHFGGGTPTYLDDRQLADLMAKLGAEFGLESGDNREFSIEVDPRSVQPTTIHRLAELGFNRLSLGIQDFDEAVQKAVNREQSVEQVAAIVRDARQSGFRSISFDLIYGLPHQSVASFDRTLEQVVGMQPDRLAIYNYAHLPERFKAQRLIRDEDLPDPATKLNILHHTIDRLAATQYCYIGMDHFALATDDLTLAQQNGTLQRNFQGYSTHADCDLIGLGASAIGRIGNVFAQNATALNDYAELIDSGRLAIVKGVEIDSDDRLRAQVIQGLMCHDRFDIRQFETAHQIRFEEYFATEMQRLQPLQADGLLECHPDCIQITARGRLLLRSIAMVFDRYLPDTTDGRFSRAI